MAVNVRHESQNQLIPMMVFYTGTLALSKSRGICWDRDAVTTKTGQVAADSWGGRSYRVNEPDPTNNNAFAGVVGQEYGAPAAGRWIEIYLVGSILEVPTLETSLTIGENSYITCLVSSDLTRNGTFNDPGVGHMGKGTARVLQTIAAAGKVLVELMDGEESGLVQEITVVELTTGTAFVATIGGVTLGRGAATVDADLTFTVADGNYPGQRKTIANVGVLTTSDIVATITSGVQLDGSTALATLTLDGALDASILEWGGPLGDGLWRLIHNVGTALA